MTEETKKEKLKERIANSLSETAEFNKTDILWHDKFTTAFQDIEAIIEEFFEAQ